MNKTEMAHKLSARLSIKHVESLRFLEACQEIFIEEVEAGHSVLLQNFGVFQPWQQTSQIGRNPRTNEPCLIQPRLSVKFKPDKGLLARIKKNRRRFSINITL